MSEREGERTGSERGAKRPVALRGAKRPAHPTHSHPVSATRVGRRSRFDRVERAGSERAAKPKTHGSSRNEKLFMPARERNWASRRKPAVDAPGISLFPTFISLSSIYVATEGTVGAEKAERTYGLPNFTCRISREVGRAESNSIQQLRYSKHVSTIGR